MQAKSNRLRTIISHMISFVLLSALAGVSLFAWGNIARAAPPGSIFKAHTVLVKPVIRELHAISSTRSDMKSAGAKADQVLFACQSNIDPQPVLCYGPDQLREAYGVSDLLNQQITGQGSTITVIDAYGSPTLRHDLQTFDTAWGLTNPRVNIRAPFGVHGSDSTWVSEVSLDVEWAHVMAPDATINLVLAKSSNDVDLYRALAYSVTHNLGDVISLSFGENENCVDPKLLRAEHTVFEEAAKKGITILAATGDLGSAQMTCDGNAYQEAVSFPADDPLVTAIGGTALSADAITGQYIRETAWNEFDAFNKATGGGYSKIYVAPAYQQGLAGGATGRGVPDISLNASVNGGVLVYQSDANSGKTAVSIMGGTSVAAPEMAGILADGVQMAHHRFGEINPALYKLGASSNYSQAMNDVISGDNVLVSSGLSGYTAGQGWSPVTGWGSPKQAVTFLQDLIAVG